MADIETQGMLPNMNVGNKKQLKIKCVTAGLEKTLLARRHLKESEIFMLIYYVIKVTTP